MFTNLFLEFYNQLNNRELSIIFWSFIFLLWAILKAKIGKSILEVLKTFLPFLGYFSFQAVYLSLCLYFLVLIGFWEISMLKDTFVITILTMFIFLNIKSHEVAKDKIYFFKLILQNLAWVGFIEIFVNFYTFPFYIELFLVPFLIIIGVLVEVSKLQEKNDKKYLITTKFLSFWQYFFGFGILIYAIFEFQKQPELFLQISTLKIFLFPFLLTFMFAPVLYFLELLKVYQWHFVTWKHVLNNQDKLKLFYLLRNKILFRHHINLYAFLYFYEKNRLKLINLENEKQVLDLFE